MRHISVFMLSLFLLKLLAPSEAIGAGDEKPAADSTTQSAPARAVLDKLFQRLKAARNVGEGRTIEADIWTHWTRSGSAQTDKLMKQARLLASRGHYEPAIGLLDRVIYMNPLYSEGWNRRATVYFFMRRDKASLLDIAKVLELEPRHFGALAGKALIHIRAGEWQPALDALRRGVEVHPFLRERHLIEELERKLNIRKL